MENITGLNYYNQVFETEDKVKAFDKLAEMFYDRNFGTAGKTEVELWLFKTFMDNLIKNNVDKNNVLDYNKTSDYTIGKMLGIPQERVRNLKIKSQARYPVEFNWVKSFCQLQENVRYDEANDMFIIPTRDPNLHYEIRNFIESNSGIWESRNGGSRIMVKPEFFFLMLYESIEEKDKEKKEKIKNEFIKKLRTLNEEYDITEIKTDKELSQAAIDSGIGFTEFINEISEYLPAPAKMLVSSIKIVKAAGKALPIGKKAK